MKKLVLASVIFASALVLCGRQADAQRRYQPRRSTLSPYLDYFRRDSGVVSPYQAFIQRNQRLSSLLDQQSQSISGLEQQLMQRPTGVRPTGTGATFFNYSHFFPGFNNTAPRRR